MKKVRVNHCLEEERLPMSYLPHTLSRPATRLSDAEANAIFLQWRANNVYHDAKFLDVKTIPF